MSYIVTSHVGRFRRVNLGQPDYEAWLFECPGCGQWAYLDEDQWGGRVSVDHASDGCRGGYHETHNYGAALVAAMQARILMGESPYEDERVEGVRDGVTEDREMSSERAQFPVVSALLNAAKDAEARARGYVESAAALRVQARTAAELEGTTTPAPTLREALDKVKALVVHWTTSRDGFHGLDPMPQEAQERYPEWGWYRAKDVKTFVAEVEAALRASEGPPEPSVSSKDVTWRFTKPEGQK